MTESYYIHLPKQFRFVIGITWNDIDNQINLEKEVGTYSKISDTTDLVTECRFTPGLLQNISSQFAKTHNMRTMHIYSSRYREAITMGRHCDDQNVLIAQSLGRMLYKFDNGDEVILNPGDGLYIPQSVYHDPIHIEPRITVSMSA